ncbi:hypothetical protein PVAND_009810 [Polypedilum vanderplanki]|uniref:Uncharacterized protein n=1 Tax=Polypedilum vanderplanki TaxID=319348 RepID=A0A9J6CDW1_POLVA|nr:hypothetical protein PVAND_009810 [Polypedilum vanderplanki]
MTTSIKVIDDSKVFLDDEEKLKYFIENGFDPQKRCQYDAMALKFQFNKLVLKITQFMTENEEQECPDIFNHMKMLRETIAAIDMSLNLDLKAEEANMSVIGTPTAKSTPKNREVLMTPDIFITSATEENNMPSVYRTAHENQSQNHLQILDHQRIFAAVNNLERTLNSLPSPLASSPRNLPPLIKKPTPKSRLPDRMPRKELGFGTE